MSKVIIEEQKLLSDNWYQLYKVKFSYINADQESVEQTREVYDRGNGATILLFNKKKNSIILTRQFRLPSFLNGNPDGFLIETCAGLLDEDDPITCIIRETEEETGYRLTEVRKVFQVYMSPGAVTEMIHFFVGRYDSEMKIGPGGGLKSEQEYIEVQEWDFDEAYARISTGEICDAKTIMLLQYAKVNDLLS